MKSNASQKVMGVGIVVAIAAVPLCASTSVHQGVSTPLQSHPGLETTRDNTPTNDIVYDSALTPASAILTTGLSQRNVFQKTPPVSNIHFHPSSALASNQRQPRSTNQDSSNWMWLIGILGFSGFVLWRFLTNLSSGNQQSSNNWFDFGSHDSSSESSSHNDYGNYSDSSDFGGGSSDGGGDGGDW